MAAPELTISDLERLMQRVNDVDLIREVDQRARVLNELRRFCGPSFDPARFAGTSRDIFSIVRTCIDNGAMLDFSRVLRMVGGETEEWRRLDELVTEFFGSSGGDRRSTYEQVSEALRGVPPEVIAGSLGHHELRGYLPDGASEFTDTGLIVHRLVGFSATTTGRPLLFFLEQVAHQLSEDRAVDLHWLIGDLARRHDESDAVGDLCRSLRSGERPADPFLVQPAPQPPASPSQPPPEEGDVKTDGTSVETRDARLAPPAPKVWGGVPPRNNNFTGRDDVLDQIAASLATYTTSALVPQPLHGLGGVGKSQVATEFAYRCQADYDLIWWIQADDERSIRRSLVSLAKRLDLPESDDAQDTVETVLDALRRGEPGRWLLIYDNAPEPAMVSRYLPSGRGHVVVTSRSRTWASESGAIEVDVFQPHESVALVRRRWASLSEEKALELAAELGHLPLALDQAVSVHEQTGMPLSEYLRALSENPGELLGEGVAGNYSLSVARTLSLGFESLQAHSPAAARLLELCVFLSSHPIAIPLLAAGRNADVPAEVRGILQSDIALRRAIRDLGKYALVQLDPGRDFIRVHSLVRAVLRDRIDPGERQAVERAAHAILAAANPREPDDPSSWHFHAHIAPHVVPSGLIYSPDVGARRAVLDQVRYQYAIGDYAASKKLGQDTLDIWRTGFGPDDELTLVMSRHLANALRALGEYRAARDLNERTLARLEATLGADHEHSLATANSVAADLRLAGQFRQALLLDEGNLRRHEEVMGPNDPGTIRVTTNLAVDHRLLGNFARAHELDSGNLERKIGQYGQDHPRTLFSYTCLVRDLYGLGRYKDGLALAQEKIPLIERRLAANHADVLIARRHLAMLLRKAGYTTLALTEAESAYEAHLQKFGFAHEHSLSALMTLTNCRRTANDLDGAVKSARRALQGYRELLPDGHPFTFACTVDLSIVLRLRGELDEAQSLNDAALVGLSGALGEDHPYALCSLHTQANGLAAQQRMAEARAADARALELSRRMRGEDHPYTLACAVNLALDLEAVGEEGPSMMLRRSTLDRIKRVLGNDHPDTANVGLYIRAESEIEVPAT